MFLRGGGMPGRVLGVAERVVVWIRVSDVEGCVRSDASRRKSFARGYERWILCTELWIAAAFKEYRVLAVRNATYTILAMLRCLCAVLL